ncbi:MAG TPA: hypothetical protein DCX54_08245 [Flavobacteriales bacterium]|nr:hypothetical protein [Flavobacteriales bacterium]
MPKPAIVCFLFSALFFSCNLVENDKREGAIARVHERYLYKEDLGDLLSKLEGDKDSATIVGNYINSWIQQELLLEKAELNLREDQKDFQKLIEDYRRSLIIYAFQKEWIKYNLDTIVGSEEIDSYYENNQANFELKENIVMARYVVAPNNAPKLKDLEKTIKGEGKNFRQDFHDYCLQYATIYQENDSTWMPLDEVLAKVPLEIDDEENFLRRNKFVFSVDTTNIYMLYIQDFKIKSSTSPLSFEREKIRSIIINQRKQALLSKMKEQMFNMALQKGKAEIY